ncbi:MAG: biotin synthase BioB [Candidatus Parabeggiatoa sp. nov. 3]|jgi:biotin synthase|nr:MAG: biotin synthase BioB [Gammaproteobacteria bacterium]RKZ68243.1 MAG: biotin synthase BioB [Gammaproteobacteria bacterium]RKZ72857.1 MAG: biotin synthase BioB [Gammaproteobacteria bacterium]HEW98390.1 biotin synthase BioB [Beggiatoa sp.]
MFKDNLLKEQPVIRHDWLLEEVSELFQQPFFDLIFKAQCTHRAHFNPNQVQLSTLLNIKTGACSEDCAYCSQSVRFKTKIESEPLMEVEKVVSAAKKAKANGATRFCMGAAWRSPKPKEFENVLEIIKAVKALGLETCMTLGMLNAEQAMLLKTAGLDYYNHNLDTSESYYENIVSTHSYQDRLETLANVRTANIKVCCGGIMGMGESLVDRAALLQTLANLPVHPESVPINQLVRVKGTPLAEVRKLDPFEMVRCIAVARIMMPTSMIRLSAGRAEMNDELQALCFLAGANSMFYGEKLLTTGNATTEHDRQLFNRLGISSIQST